MLHAKNVPPQFWAKCMKTVAYMINRLPQAPLGSVSPFEKLRNIKPTEVIFEFLVVYVMFSYQIIYEASLIRKQ